MSMGLDPAGMEPEVQSTGASQLRALALAYSAIWAEISRTVNVLALEGAVQDPTSAHLGTLVGYLHSHRHHVRTLQAALERADGHVVSMLDLLDQPSPSGS